MLLCYLCPSIKTTTMKIGITNLKGGVGKTTISQNLAVCLAHLDYRVTILDTDRNQNSITWSGVRSDEYPEVVAVGATEPKTLNKVANKLEESSDFVILDGTPTLSEMTTRIVLASDLLIIPITPSVQDIRAMAQFVERLEQAKEFRDEIPAYIVLNQYEGYSVQKQLVEKMKEFGIPILETKFRERISYVEAAIDGRGVIECADNKAATESASFTKEIIEIATELGLMG